MKALPARYYWGLLLYLLSAAISSTVCLDSDKSHKCGENGQKLKYVWGDALTDSADCIGPNNTPYPLPFINRTFRKNWASSMRTGRSFSTIDPLMTKQILLDNYENNRDARGSDVTLSRERRDLHYREVNMCQSANPTRLCKTRYNTTAPMYGVSLTSGQPVTIVQKFPDLLQQVIYEVCESSECDLVHGECTQTFVPYLFLVIPLGPVTLTGQDYVLVESGCVCKPKYPNSASKSMSALPTL
ncbi:hypothetical protein V9T40_012015 [Parthenolecanium corni]|uniref:Uncharacterized protein n=1 Tax=Parthenolecanium corni TaxID=536013 RepID=A0AAN9T9X0_9HEMI